MSTQTIATEKPDYDTFGGRLLRARMASGMSAIELAKGVAVKRTTIEAWEADRSEPRSNKIPTLAGMLGVSATWLLYGVGASPQTETISDEVQVLKGQLQRLRELNEQTGIAIETISDALDNISFRQAEGVDEE